MGKKSCIIIGVGEGLGSALAATFSKAGYETVITRRHRHLNELQELAASIGSNAHAIGLDAREESEIEELFKRVEFQIAPIEVVIFNIGANVQFGITETTSQVFRKVWEMACFSGFLAGREAAKYMKPRSKGTIIFTGATASSRGGSGFAAFASAKAGLRNLAQSMARELGPKGIHVAHTVIDGLMDGNFARHNFPNVAELAQVGAILDPKEVANNYLALVKQENSAWTFEMDMRPWSEKW